MSSHSDCAGSQRSFRDPAGTRVTVQYMDEFRARRVVDSLRDHGVDAHLLRGGNGKFGIRLPLPGGREAEWDSDGTASLKAMVVRDGMLVGYVPRIDGSEDFDETRIVDAIIRTDYNQPVARQRTVAPAPAPALPREGGVFRRFLDGFRYRLPSPGQRIALGSPQGERDHDTAAESIDSRAPGGRLPGHLEAERQRG
jgi:hypothetical protein